MLVGNCRLEGSAKCIRLFLKCEKMLALALTSPQQVGSARLFWVGFGIKAPVSYDSSEHLTVISVINVVLILAL